MWTSKAGVITAAVVLLPVVLLMVTVMVLAIASLVVPARRQRHLLAVLDRLVQVASALRGSGPRDQTPAAPARMPCRRPRRPRL
jgi:hypothetical protein